MVRPSDFAEAAKRRKSFETSCGPGGDDFDKKPHSSFWEGGVSMCLRSRHGPRMAENASEYAPKPTRPAEAALTSVTDTKKSEKHEGRESETTRVPWLEAVLGRADAKLLRTATTLAVLVCK